MMSVSGRPRKQVPWAPSPQGKRCRCRSPLARHPGTDAAEPWKGGAPVSEAEHVEGPKTEAAGDAEPAAVAGKPPAPGG